MPRKASSPVLNATAMLAALVSFLPQPCRAAIPALKPVRIESLTLPNGLRALLEEDRDLPVATVEVWYHVGSKDEVAGEKGFAHLFEHLMFDGTRNVGPGEFATAVVRAGGEVNAYTTQDVTVFWETVPSVTLPQVLWLEADRMRNLDITQRQLDNERQVVEEEGRQRFGNTPYGTVIEQLYATAFRVHPYAHLPIGSREDLDRATVRDIKNFHDTYYVPDHATLLVVGDFDARDVASWIQKDFGGIAAERPIHRDVPAEPPQHAERVAKMSLAVGLPAFMEGFRIAADGTPDSYALELLVKILSQGESSLLYRSLVYHKQMAVEAEGNASFTEDPNLFYIFVIMNPGTTVAEGEKAVANILERLKKEPVSAQELQRAKNQVMQDWVVGRETTRGRAEQLGEDGVILRDPDLVNSEINRALAVTAEEIQAAARKYFTRQNMTLIEVEPSL